MELISSGGYGQVFKTQYNGKDVACKVFYKKQELHDELEVLNKMQHVPHTPLVYGHEGTKLYMNLVNGADLTKSTEKPTKDQWLDLLNAVEAVHDRGYIHCDIKPSNVIATEDALWLIDFGLAQRIRGEHKLKTGTPGYLAPELIEGGEAVGPWSDIYSLGCLMHAVMSGTGKSPFRRDGMYQTVVSQISGDFSIDTTFDDKYKEIISKCITRDPSERFQSISKLKMEI